MARTLKKKASGKKGFKPPLWSEDMYGSAHGDWESHAILALKTDDVKPARIMELERVLRQRVNGKKDRHDVAKDFLHRILSRGEHKDPKLRKGRLSDERFVRVLQSKLQVPLTIDEARAIFRKYGHDAKGRLPYDLFCRRLFTSSAHVMALQGSRSKPYDAADKSSWSHQAMVRYRYCKKGVYPPSNWKATGHEICEASSRKPDAYLRLDHVFGYSGTENKSPNLFFNHNGDPVYYTAAVGIVYDDDNNIQKFFLRHSDDMTCLTMHPNRDTIASGQKGAEPIVWIWSSTTKVGGEKGVGGGPVDVSDKPIEPIKITLPYGERSVACLGFSMSDNGKYLASVSTNKEHTVRVYDWKRPNPDTGGFGVALAEAGGTQGTPPQEFAIVWNKWAGTDTGHFSDFVTCGVNHINFWTFDAAAKTLTSEGGAFGATTMQDVLHACYLSTGQVLAGGPNGSITVYEEKVAVKEITSGHASFCRCLLVYGDGDTKVASAGGDGHIIVWEIQPGEAELLKEENRYLVEEADGDRPAFLGLDVDPTDDQLFVAGSAGNDIYKIMDPGGPDNIDTLVEGQSADVYGVAGVPTAEQSHIYASGCEDGHVYLWDAVQRKGLKNFLVVREGEHKRAKDGKIVGYKNDVLKVKAVTFNHQGTLFALSTTGVCEPPDYTDEMRDNDEWFKGKDDEGGVLQVFNLSADWYVDDSENEDFDELQFAAKHRIFEVKDSNEMIDDIKFSPSGLYLAAGSHDNYIYIYDIGSGFGLSGICRGHSSFISHFDWNADSNLIMSNSGDYEILYWDVEGKQVLEDTRDEEFATWTSVLGFQVMGMWQDGMDGTDINAVCRSHNENFCTVASDDGLVRLFNYPIVVDEAPHRAFTAHSSFVQNIRFLADDTYVITAGGPDCSMMQWRTHGITEESRHFKKRKGVKPRYKKVDVPSSNMPSLEDAAADRSTGGADVQLDLRLRDLKSLYTSQRSLLEQRDKEIIYLKQQLQLRAAGIHRRKPSEARSTKAKPREPIKLDPEQLKQAYGKIARKSKVRLPEFKVFLQNAGFKKSQDVGARLFNAFDSNGDGELEPEEFITSLTLMTAGDVESKLEFVFTMLDKDRSGGISEIEIRLFMKGFFVLTKDVIGMVLTAVEGLVGSTGSSKNNFQAKLAKQADKLIARRVDTITTEAMIIADESNDSKISFDEFRAWIDKEPQVMGWVDGLGAYWGSMAMASSEQNMDPRLVKGKDDAQRQLNATMVAEHLTAKMGGIPLTLLVNAVEVTPDAIDEDECYECIKTIGIDSQLLSSALFKAFNDTSGGKVECRAIMCGISLLCCTSAKTSEKMSFAFAIFDKNADESLTKEEIAEFFDLFRGPVFTVVERSMSNFYETCGFEDDFREIVQDLVDGSLKRHIVAIVKDAVESDSNHDEKLSKAEFMAWSKRNRHVGRWIENLSRFTLNSLGQHLTVKDLPDSCFNIKP